MVEETVQEDLLELPELLTLAEAVEVEELQQTEVPEDQA
jgi:hypothetical protein